MATWEDGPEYAPLERPAAFSEPPVEPLQDAETEVALSAGAPVQQPRFDAPTAPVARLAALVPATTGEARDPQRPFDVVSATLTPDPVGPFGSAPVHATPGAWGSAHWTPPPPSAGQQPGPWGPPTGTPWPAPTAPFPAGQAQLPPGQFPTPGSPQWFGPGPTPPVVPLSATDAKAVVAAVTPGLLITLGLGFIYPIAPFTLCVGFFLTTRLRVAKAQVQRVFLGALALLALVAMVAAVANLGTFGDWWRVVGRWALVVSVVLLVVVPLLVRRELLAGQQRRQQWP